MKQHDDFIATYKELEEAIVKKHPKVGESRDVSPIRWAEDNYPDKISKLRYCRNTRNYVQHEGDYEKFISISPEMIVFMQEFIGELVGTAKSMSKGLKTCSVLPTDTVFNAAKKMKKESSILVADQDQIYGILYEGDIKVSFANELLTKKTKVSAVINEKTSGNVSEIKDSDSGEAVLKKLSKYDYLVVRNKQNKIVGVIKK